MKILIADTDRDLLMCFKKLLEMESNEVSTVFDGTQVISKMAKQHFDVVILNRNIPRVESKAIIKHLNEENIPVIALSEDRINSEILLSEELANAYLSFPFLPSELIQLIDEVTVKASSNEQTEFMDVRIDVSDFKLCGKVRLTNEEINIFKALVNNEDINVKRAGPYINSLNNKLDRLNKKLNIKYVISEGYRLVK